MNAPTPANPGGPKPEMASEEQRQPRPASVPGISGHRAGINHRAAWRWFYPGVRLKRWLVLLALSACVLGVGISGMMGNMFRSLEFKVVDVRPLARQIQSLRTIDFALLLIGIAGGIFAIRRGLYSVLAVALPEREKDFPTLALKHLRLKRGPRIVAIGGGTGLPALLSGLKKYTANITAIVTMADDGGSSGRLRRENQMLPPGDLRNCLVAMAETSPLMSQLFQHRFQSGGGLQGHSFGNLFITALSEVTGDFASGIKAASQVLAVAGRVLPVTLDSVNLEAELKNGETIRGESLIGQSREPIQTLRLIPPEVKPAPEVREAIRQADAIVIGPGSLYTSILPNLLVPGVAQEIERSRAVKIFVCNVMTQPGETNGMGVADHYRVLREHTQMPLVQYVIVNSELPERTVLESYLRMGAQPVLASAQDAEQLERWGANLIRARLGVARHFFRHDPMRLSRAILKLVVL